MSKSKNFIFFFVAFLLISIARFSMADTWTPTYDNIAIARSRHTATLLRNGNVLLAGGLDSTNNATATSELYDPESDTWTLTDNDMVTARSRHTATLLLNGKVLVAGGRSQDDLSLASAELYDPSMDTWEPTGSMAIPRDNHTAVLLPDGRVLVAGGTGVIGPQHNVEKTAEIYDPQTGTWSLTDHMANARFGHQATLLANGRVLVTGGSPPGLDCGAQATAEIYDPHTGRWAGTSKTGVGHSFHFATELPDGMVLVAGGYASPPTCNSVTSKTELYDPATGRWTASGNLSTGRGGIIPGTLLLNGKALIVGGRVQSGSITIKTATAELYDPASGTWSLVASMGKVRTSHTLTLLTDGRVLVAGGRDNSDTLDTAEIYTP